MPTRLTWMVVGGAVALIARSRAEQAVADEARRLPARLPGGAGRVAELLPHDVARAAGAAVVAARTAGVGGRVGYRAAVVGGRGALVAGSGAAVAGRVAADGAVAARHLARRARDEVHATTTLWRAAAQDEERHLRAELALLAGDPVGAVDALLDRRHAPAAVEVPLPVAPPPVAAGRVRSDRPRPRPAARVQRSYQRPDRRW